MRRTLLLTVLALGLLAQTAAARGPAQIVNGDPAAEGEYPSQGFLLFDADPGPAVKLFSCGGTLVAATKFLTAAHCTVDDFNRPLPPENFQVYLGENNQSDYFPTPDPDELFLVDTVEVHPHYAEDAGGHTNDVTMLTLETPAPFAITRVIRPNETALWSPGDIATIIGWGATVEDGNDSDALLEATVPIRTDAACSSYGSFFVPSTMLCAGSADPPGSSDTCQGDSGGPLLVGDAAPLVLAGVVSWGNGCNRDGFPGIYARVGAPALNAWVRGRLSSVDFTVSSTPRAGAPTSFSATAPGSTGLTWNFGDGVVDTTGTATPSHTYPAAGTYEAVLRVTDPEGQPAEQRRTVVVGTPAPVIPPPPVAPIVPGPAPQPDLTLQTPLATILALSQPKVRRGRFSIRLNFTANAPRGVAVIEVFRGKKKIGGGRTRVRRDDSRRVTVKLNKAGKRLLRRSSTKRLKVRIQVRVKRQVLRSKTVTLRR